MRRRPPYGRVFARLLFLLAVCIGWTGCMEEPVRTVDGLRVEVLEDPTGSLRAEAVHSRTLDLLPTETERPNLGSTESAFWVRVDGWQGAPRQARVTLANPTLDSIEVYVIDGPRVLARQQSGAAYGRAKTRGPSIT